MKYIYRSLIFVEAVVALLGLWLVCLQAAGAIRWPMDLVLAPFWCIGAVRGLWSSFAAMLAATVVFCHRAQIYEAQRIRAELLRSCSHKRKARR